jgi:hypothetical protein
VRIGMVRALSATPMIAIEKGCFKTTYKAEVSDVPPR